jgi:hypothetical protein
MNLHGDKCVTLMIAMNTRKLQMLADELLMFIRVVDGHRTMCVTVRTESMTLNKTYFISALVIEKICAIMA